MLSPSVPNGRRRARRDTYDLQSIYRQHRPQTRVLKRQLIIPAARRSYGRVEKSIGTAVEIRAAGPPESRRCAPDAAILFGATQRPIATHRPSATPLLGPSLVPRDTGFRRGVAGFEISSYNHVSRESRIGKRQIAEFGVGGDGRGHVPLPRPQRPRRAAPVLPRGGGPGVDTHSGSARAEPGFSG